ncbi:hypothetical protein CcrC1_gp497 [Caulobacter phage C1]|nr:hypothetical protein CcrC1_gp497 [Caulobacter phage C1]
MQSRSTLTPALAAPRAPRRASCIWDLNLTSDHFPQAPGRPMSTILDIDRCHRSST